MDMSRFGLTIALSLMFLGHSQGEEPNAWITGETLDCFGGIPTRPADIDIYLFDPVQASKVVQILHKMKIESASGNKGTEKFFASYLDLAKEVQRTSALGHLKSDKSGAFSFSNLTSGRRLLVVGLTELEDEPAYYSYKMLHSIKPGENKIVLDFYDDGVPCKKPKSAYMHYSSYRGSLQSLADYVFGA
jgi:hypothetical protein